MVDDIRYGPDNPHPLSTRKTELVWEGKYDEYGNRREVDIAGCAMPLQKIETVDEPRSRAEGQQLRFDTEKAHRDDFRNMLIWGDNKLVMASLLKDFKGKIDLIYIDPPFDVGADFTMDVLIGDSRESVEKDQSVLEMVAYRDMWGRGVDSYLQMMHDRLLLMKELLAEHGSIYVHSDWRVAHYVKLLLDEIFGGDQFLNEVARQKTMSRKAQSRSFGNMHDTVFFYSKGANYRFNPQVDPREERAREVRFPEVEEQTGRRYVWDNFTQAGDGPPRRFGDRVLAPPPGKHWIWSQERIDEAWAEGIIQIRGNMPRLKRYETEGLFAGDLWVGKEWVIHSQSQEATGYDTQKPESLLERIVSASSNEGDLVADFFCGSGTTLAVAERLGRRWIGCDFGRFGVHTSRKRLIDLQRRLHGDGNPYRSFDVYNLGRYERQWWQKESLRDADGEHRRVVLEFYRAEPLESSPSPLLHGRKGQTLVHVDTIDTILTRDEVTAVAVAAKEAGAREVACLSWEFEMELRLTCNRLEQELSVKIKLIPIPCEIMEKNRKEPPPFLEVATLEAEPVMRDIGGQKRVDIKLTRFLPSLAEVPTKELEALKERAINSGFDFIDFWAVDFDYRHGEPFNHHWQAYRTRKNRLLPTVSDLAYEYSTPGPHTACVKVVDVFGCDTSITVKVPL